MRVRERERERARERERERERERVGVRDRGDVQETKKVSICSNNSSNYLPTHGHFHCILVTKYHTRHRDTPKRKCA